MRIPSDLTLASTKAVVASSSTTTSTKPLKTTTATPLRQHQRHHSQYYPRQEQQGVLLQKPPAPLPQQNLHSFPRSVSSVITPGRRAIVSHSETAVPCRVTLYGTDTHGIEKGLGTLVPPPQFRLVPVNPPAAASWHLKITDGESQERQKFSGTHESRKVSSEQSSWEQDKPRSWDNLLSTKSYGGYGFGYGFIDVNTVRISGKGSKDGKSISTHRLNEHSGDNPKTESTADDWDDYEGCRTVPRRLRPTTTSADNLLSPSVDASSCFSCDCIGLDHPSAIDGCMFNKPKSTESLLAGPNMMAAASETSLADHLQQQAQLTPQQAAAAAHRRRSRTSSFADCLGGNKPSNKEQMTHL